MRTAAAAILALTLIISAATAKEEDLSVVPELGTYIRCWGYLAKMKVINDLIDYTVDGTLPGKDTCKFVQKASDDGFCIPSMFLIWQEKYGYNRDEMIKLEDHCKKFN